MENRLEKFITTNREAFDDAEPPELWHNIEKNIVAGRVVNPAPAQGGLENFVQINREAFDDEQPSGKVWGNIEKQFVAGLKGGVKQNGLEKFVGANREAFDDEQPSAKVWKNLEKLFGAGDDRTISINRNLFVRAMAVAAVLIFVAAGAWLLLKRDTNNNTVNNIASVVVVPHDSSIQQKTPAPVEQQPSIDSLQTVQAAKPSKAETDDNGYGEEIFYYTKLTEIKFKQLKRIEKEDPVLYHSFYSEIQKLDSTYHNLQALLASNADKEAVLNAMLTNLKIQTEVLNKQLSIIKTIKQSKKKEYENDFKSM